MPDLKPFRDQLKLESGEENPAHAKMLEHVLGLFKISRGEMGKFYSTWDYHDEVFRSRRAADKDDRNAAAKGQPGKLIVPLMYSQVMTWVAFCVQNVTQNARFFELEIEGNKVAAPLKEPIELILERDLRRNQWTAFLVQYFLDLARFWVGAAEVCWKDEGRYVRISQTVPETGAFGVEGTTSTSKFERVPTFQGNKVYPISPYRIFPDTRLPLTRYQEGEFCGSEDMFSISSLRADDENLFNLERIPKMSKKDYDARREHSRIDEMPFIETRNGGPVGEGSSPDAEMQTTGSCVVSKMVFDLIPNDFEVEGEKVLGTEKHTVRYICWVANDKTIVRFEEAYYLHGMFPYMIAQFLPDQHKTINEGLSSVCDQITNLITWKLNAHLQSQKNSVQSKWIIDPAGIDTKNLDTNNPFMYLKKNASQTGVDRYIKQFVTQDVTAGVMNDIAGLKDLLESITGISGQMQGQYSAGRRSATQDRVVAQGAAARAKTTLSSVWDAAFEPLGRQLICNNRQEMDEQTFYRIVGDGPFDQNDGTELTREELFALFKADPLTIAASEDFFVFDGTLPSEKAFLAQSLQEIWMTIMSNPAIAQVMGYGPEQIRYLFNEIYELRGVTPPQMPKATPQAPQIVQPPQLLEAPAA